jgi:hypothetical protein
MMMLQKYQFEIRDCSHISCFKLDEQYFMENFTLLVSLVVFIIRL